MIRCTKGSCPKMAIGTTRLCRKHLKRKKKQEKARKYPNAYKSKRHTVTSRIMKLRKRATPAELSFKEKLRKFDLKFKFQRGFIKGKGYAIVDFYIPRWKLCIEIDGGYHSTPEQQRKDKWRDNWLKDDRKVEVVRMTNERAISITHDELDYLLAEWEDDYEQRKISHYLSRKVGTVSERE